MFSNWDPNLVGGSLRPQDKLKINTVYNMCFFLVGPVILSDNCVRMNPKRIELSS